VLFASCFCLLLFIHQLLCETQQAGRKPPRLHLEQATSIRQDRQKAPPTPTAATATIMMIVLHYSQSTHNTDSLTSAQTQGMHISQGTHITDSLTIAQMQGMHTSQGTHITDSLTIA
jgi:hypothetical protein